MLLDPSSFDPSTQINPMTGSMLIHSAMVNGNLVVIFMDEILFSTSEGTPLPVEDSPKGANSDIITC